MTYLEDLGTVVEVAPEDVAGNKENKAELANARDEADRKREYETLWELETWKKAEEARFGAYLKDRLQFQLAEMAKSWKTKKEEREKEFADTQEAIKRVQRDLAKKAKDLQKREQKLVTLEEELKQKVVQVSRQLAAKEEEIITVRTKSKDDRMTVDRDKAALQQQLAAVKQKLAEITDKQAILKKEMEETSMSQLKQELSAKGVEVIELEKKLEKSVQVRELYKTQYEKIKEEILRVRESVQSAREAEMRRQSDEIDKLRMQLQQKPAEQVPTAQPPVEERKADSLRGSKREEPTAGQSNVFLHNYEPEQRRVESIPKSNGKVTIGR